MSSVRDSVPRSLPSAGQCHVRCLHPGHSDTETQQQGQHGSNQSAYATFKTFKQNKVYFKTVMHRLL